MTRLGSNFQNSLSTWCIASMVSLAWASVASVASGILMLTYVSYCVGETFKSDVGS